ncbi:MAG: hypothetical protein HY908_04325 [Myxococcales bacterium]|nr:hypothetical protein [Myxococcales bacterium]
MRRWLLGSLVVSGLALCLPAACYFRVWDAEHCHYGGTTYLPGESFPSTDGCNSCSCTSDGDVACTAMACISCSYGGRVYQAGDTFPRADGCGTCSCHFDGSVSCEATACAVGCEHGGPSYALGDTITAGDGCNSCSCTQAGFACTEMACACDPAREHGRYYVADTPAECAVIDYLCPTNALPFANACGCGCEQALVCPAYFDCMPGPDGPGCDTVALHELCPYSQFAL